MTRVYYKEAVGAFVVFDIQRLSTFEAVAQWKADIDAKVTWGPDNKPIPVVLLANKCDLAREAFCKTPQEMDSYVQEHGFIGWYETSAKDNKGIDVAAKSLVGYILEHDDRRAPEKDPGIIRPLAEPVPKKDTQTSGSGGGCCH